MIPVHDFSLSVPTTAAESAESGLTAASSIPQDCPSESNPAIHVNKGARCRESGLQEEAPRQGPGLGISSIPKETSAGRTFPICEVARGRRSQK